MRQKAVGHLAVATGALTYGFETRETSKRPRSGPGARTPRSARGQGGDRGRRGLGRVTAPSYLRREVLSPDTIIDASHIDVDTNGDTRTGTLKARSHGGAEAAATASRWEGGATLCQPITVAS